MAVFRVEKNRDYTVISNHHLRNADLSLKSKGLLSQMLSLPEEWDYTLNNVVNLSRHYHIIPTGNNSKNLIKLLTSKPKNVAAQLIINFDCEAAK